MDVILYIFSVLCLLTGFLGCILPAVPGPPLAYVGMLLLHLTDRVQFGTTELLVWLGIVVIVQLLDNFIPMLGTKYSNGSKWGTWGAFIGSIVGLFFLPWGLIAGPFLGAVVGELLGENSMAQALRSGMGSVIGFLFGTILKLVLCSYFIAQFFYAVVG